MKYLLLLLLLCLVACKKEKTKPISELSAIRNGQYWHPSVGVYNYNPNTQRFDIDAIGSPIDVFNVYLDFSNVPLVTQRYYLNSTSVSDTTHPQVTCYEGGSDFIAAVWGIVRDSQPNNYIDVLHYDEATKMLEGRFACTLFKVHPDSSTWATDSIVFDEGYFKVYIDK